MKFLKEQADMRIYFPGRFDEGGESGWAARVDDGPEFDGYDSNSPRKLCELRNVFYSGPTLGDIVEYAENDGMNEFVGIVEQKSYVIAFTYDNSGNKEEVLDRWRQIVEYFDGNDVWTEGIVAGMALAAVPFEISQSKFLELLYACPVDLELMENDNDEDEDEGDGGWGTDAWGDDYDDDYDEDDDYED